VEPLPNVCSTCWLTHTFASRFSERRVSVAEDEANEWPFCHINAVRWTDDDHCEVECGYSYALLMGHGVVRQIERQGDHWVVTGRRGTWIS
jgi:hypothetical protein